MKRIHHGLLGLAATGLLLLGMGSMSAQAAEPAAEKVLMMATTTSTNDTGLLDVLAPIFKDETGIELRWTSVGTGKALELGRRCDADVLLVHAPAAEQDFVEAGSALGRREVMYNDYVIVGPVDDLAKIAGKPALEALKAIAATQDARFISRGDDSGTHKLELALWKQADTNVADKQAWYVESGQGMLKTLAMAGEMGGYAITDRGTWIVYEDSIAEGGSMLLKIISEKDASLYNQYSVLVINPEKCPNTKLEEAQAFSDWMANPSTQEKIAAFTLKGKALFTPNAQK